MTCDSQRFIFGAATARRLAEEMTPADLEARRVDYAARGLPRMAEIAQWALDLQEA